MKKLITEIAVFAALAIFGVLFTVHFILPGEEKYECQTWQKYAQESPRVFQPSAWQKKQCEAHGIKIDAPAKR